MKIIGAKYVLMVMAILLMEIIVKNAMNLVILVMDKDRKIAFRAKMI
jgi:hypothetical protein